MIISSTRVRPRLRPRPATTSAQTEVQAQTSTLRGDGFDSRDRKVVGMKETLRKPVALAGGAGAALALGVGVVVGAPLIGAAIGGTIAAAAAVNAFKQTPVYGQKRARLEPTPKPEISPEAPKSEPKPQPKPQAEPMSSPDLKESPKQIEEEESESEDVVAETQPPAPKSSTEDTETVKMMQVFQAMECTNCGAPVPKGGACGHCGTEYQMVNVPMGVA